MLSTGCMEHYGISNPRFVELVRFSNMDAQREIETKKLEAQQAKILRKKLVGRKLGKFLAKQEKYDRNCSNPIVGIPVAEQEAEQETTTFLQRCGCAKGGDKKTFSEEEIGARQWLAQMCKDRHDFFYLMRLTTNNIQKSLPALKELRSRLEYSNNPAAEVQGLTPIGGRMWLLTYGLQHIIDPKSKYKKLTEEVTHIRALYEGIARATQQFVDMVEAFCVIVKKVRKNGITILKRLRRTYNIELNPLDLRPEKPKLKKILAHRRIEYDFEPIDKRDGFHVRWVPDNIVFKATGYWETFATLPIHIKLKIYTEFFEAELASLQSEIQVFETCTKPITSLLTSAQAGTAVTSTLNEVTCAMVKFINSHKPHPPKQFPLPQNWSLLLEEFWLTIDLMYELTFELSVLTLECRDIVQTCYQYTKNFYHWVLPEFDEFNPKAKSKGHKEGLTKKHKFVGNKILGGTRYEDAAWALSIADFCSSIYQEAVKQHGIEAAGLELKLECWDDQIETWGLVGRSEHSIYRRSTITPLPNDIQSKITGDSGLEGDNDSGIIHIQASRPLYKHLESTVKRDNISSSPVEEIVKPKPPDSGTTMLGAVSKTG